MRRPNLTTSTIAIAIGGLLTLGLTSEAAFANWQTDDLRQGLPGRRISGGSRSPSNACLTTPNQPVIALIPEENVGLTLSEHPTFWFSLPAVSNDRELEFGLFDEAGEVVYQKTFEASGKAGITHLSLPETTTALETNKAYRWYLSIVCDPESRAEDLFVTGWIERIQPGNEMRQQLATATSQERLALYEESALWYDALTTLAELRQNNPTAIELTQRWSNLLESVSLAQAISAPLNSPIENTPF